MLSPLKRTNLNSPSPEDLNRSSFRNVVFSSFRIPDDGKKKGKAIPETGRGGPQGCKKSRLPHFLDNWLTDGGEVVSLTRRPPFTPQEDSWYSFLLVAESTPGP
jgi:hypothetical protein